MKKKGKDDGGQSDPVFEQSNLRCMQTGWKNQIEVCTCASWSFAQVWIRSGYQSCHKNIIYPSQSADQLESSVLMCDILLLAGRQDVLCNNVILSSRHIFLVWASSTRTWLSLAIFPMLGGGGGRRRGGRQTWINTECTSVACRWIWSRWL